MKLSFTLCGGLGDFILRYCGSPGNRLAHILKICPDIIFRLEKNPAGMQLVQGNPFFHEAYQFEAADSHSENQPRLPNDIAFIQNLNDYPKLPVPLWLDEKEQAILATLKKPYGVFHPYASHYARHLTPHFDIKKMAQYIADYSGIPLVVVGAEDYKYSSHNVINLTKQGSPRLACKVIEQASFFVGTHSSMQCAAWVYEIPSLCIGPNHLLFHAYYAPNSYEYYLKPLFASKSVFMLFTEAELFPQFFEHFFAQATSLQPRQIPELSRRELALSGTVLDTKPVLSDSGRS